MRTIEEAKAMLEELGRMQEEGRAAGLPCPRCGRFRMDDNPVRNAMSRRAKVYICDQCGMDEALLDMAKKEPLPLNQWGMVLGFDEVGPDDPADEEE